MNKRIQVVVPHWLDEYIGFLIEKYDLNTSELIRMYLCVGIITLTESLYPDFKSDIDFSDFRQDFQSRPMEDVDRERLFKAMSKIYFEARKAVEFRMTAEQKREKERKRE
jgi:hypothetical protein